MNRTESMDFAKMRQEQIEREKSVSRSYEESIIRIQNQLQKLSAMLSRQSDSEQEPAPKDYGSIVRGYEESFTRVQKLLQQLSEMLSRQSDFAPASKYDPDQPRDDLGRFALIGTSKPGGDDSSDQGNIDGNAPGQIIPVGTNTPFGRTGSPGIGEMNIDGAATYIKKHAKPKRPPKGKGECATYVREAIEKGGEVKLVDRPKPARKYYPYLDKYFTRLTPKEMEDYTPQKGDIAVFRSPDDDHEHGHIQMYSRDDSNNEGEWISDYVQPGFLPGSAYSKLDKTNPKDIAVYRPKDWKPAPKPPESTNV